MHDISNLDVDAPYIQDKSFLFRPCTPSTRLVAYSAILTLATGAVAHGSLCDAGGSPESRYCKSEPAIVHYPHIESASTTSSMAAGVSLALVSTDTR